MSDERFKETMIECVDLIFHFLKERIDECPQFIYIIDLAMNRVFVDPQMPFLKNSQSLNLTLFLSLTTEAATTKSDTE